MIYESSDWKKELNSRVCSFKRFLKQRKRYTETVAVQIELFFFQTCFIVRKLSDSNKLSDEVEKFLMPVKEYPNRKKFYWYMDRYDIDEHFDLNNSKGSSITLRKLVNLGIHSYSFVIDDFDQDGWNKNDFSVYINTDYTKNILIYEIDIKSYLSFLKVVIKDHIVSSHMQRDEKSGEMKIISKSSSLKNKH